MTDAVHRRERLLLEAEVLGGTGSWEMDLVTGEVASTAGNRRLFFGDAPTDGTELDDYAAAIHPADRDEVMRRREELLAGSGSPEIEFRVVWRDGSVRDILGRQQVIRDERGNPVRTMGINADVTERKRAEAAVTTLQRQLMFADRMVSMGTVAAGVAHEINNPLAYVLSNIEFALERLAAAPTDTLGPVQEALAEARQGTERVRAIVRDLKTFSRPDDSKMGDVDVRRILDSSVHMASSQALNRARVVRDYQPVPLVTANEARLGQVFLNLVINAAQAIPEGDAARNEIRVSTATDASGRAVIAVRDTGKGMTREVQARIFEPFFTTKPTGEGTGLGLAICHQIVTALGGEIVVVSEPGKGTELSVVLPAARSAPEPVTASVTPLRPTRRGRVLIVDDEPVIARTLSRLLKADHDVTIADGSRDALARIGAGEHFDVVLCDLMMPDISGMALHEELMRVDPAAAGRVVFITGGASTPTAREFLARVPNTILEKPFSVEDLQSVLRRLVG